MSSDAPLSYRTGSLVWVKQRGFPWWPSMVTYDPATASYSKSKDPSKPPNQYHCQFFGITPMRAWVSANTSLRPWEGDKGAGVDLREQQKMSKKWQGEFPVALEQAEAAFGLNYMQRLGMCGCNFQPEGTAHADVDGGDDEGGDDMREGSSDDSSDESEEEPEEIWVQPDDPNKPKRALSGYMFFAGVRISVWAASRQPPLGACIEGGASPRGRGISIAAIL
jgi:hypothetical protein